MSKLPYMQFYPATRGIWIELLRCMWDSPERGQVSGRPENFARLIGCSAEEFTAAVDEISALKIADVTICNGIVTVINRRMAKGYKRPRPSQSVWGKIRDFVFRRDDYTCQYCGDRGGRLERDHVVPIAKGGTHDLSNLVTACFRCNRSKKDKTVEQWRAA